MLLDFDPDVVGVASQPFWLSWREDGRERRHAPDFFARRLDGTGVVIDVRADDRVEPVDVEAFEATARACAQAGGCSAGSGRRMRCWPRTCAGCRATGIPTSAAPSNNGLGSANTALR
jgi:hypothetical protein